MAIAIPTSRQALANAYAALGSYLALCTGSPGTSTTVANEASGGSYARVATSWTAGSGGVQNGSATTLNANAATYTYAALCSAATGNTQVDNCAITSTVLSAAGQIVLTPTYTQS